MWLLVLVQQGFCSSDLSLYCSSFLNSRAALSPVALFVSIRSIQTS